MNHIAGLPGICIVANIPGESAVDGSPTTFWESLNGGRMFKSLSVSFPAPLPLSCRWGVAYLIGQFWDRNQAIFTNGRDHYIFSVKYFLPSFLFLLLFWCDINEQSQDPFVPDYFILSCLLFVCFACFPKCCHENSSSLYPTAQPEGDIFQVGEKGLCGQFDEVASCPQSPQSSTSDMFTLVPIKVTFYTAYIWSCFLYV